MHIGISESQTRAILDKELAALGLVGEGGLVIFGGVSVASDTFMLILITPVGDAAEPHGSGTDLALSKEDFVLIDVGGEWGGYVADITRVSNQHLRMLSKLMAFI